MNKLHIIALNDPHQWQVEIEELSLTRNSCSAQEIDIDHFITGYIVRDDMSNILAGCIVYYNEDWTEKYGRIASFGNLICIDDQNVFDFLIEQLKLLCKKNHFVSILGPLNGNTWSNYRVALSNLEFNYFLDIQQPEYYTALFAHSPLTVVREYYTSIDESLAIKEEKYHNLLLRATGQNISIRKIDLSNFENELRLIHAFCVESFRNSFLYSPIELSDFKSKYLPMLPYLKPDLILFAMVDSLMVGLLFAVDNTLDKVRKGVVVKTLARLPAYDGVAGLLGATFYKYLQSESYDYALHAFMEQSNRSVNMSRDFNGKTIKSYGLYEVKIY